MQFIADAIKSNRIMNSIKLEKINNDNNNIFDAMKVNYSISKYSLSYNCDIKLKIILNFFVDQKQVKYFEYIVFNPDDDKNKKKEFNLEGKKLFFKFKTDRSDMEFIYR